MRCPNCNAGNSTGGRVCTSCGTLIAGSGLKQDTGLILGFKLFLGIRARTLLPWVLLIIGIPLAVSGAGAFFEGLAAGYGSMDCGLDGECEFTAKAGYGLTMAVAGLMLTLIGFVLRPWR